MATHLERAAEHFGLFLANIRSATGGDLMLSDHACAVLLADALDVMDPDGDAEYVARTVIRATLHVIIDSESLAKDNGESPA